MHAHDEQSDVVVVQSIPTGVANLARYMHADGSHAGPPIVSWVPQLKQRQLPDDLRRFIAGRTAVHLVRFHDVGSPLPQHDWLKQHAVEAGRREFQNVWVYKFTPRDGAARFTGE